MCPASRSSETESGVEALRGVGVCAIAVEYLIKYADLIFSNRLQSSSLMTRSGMSLFYLCSKFNLFISLLLMVDCLIR